MTVTFNDLEKKLLTREGQYLEIQKRICDQLLGVFGSVGYLGMPMVNTQSDMKQKRWRWETKSYGLAVEFSNPLYRDAIEVRGKPTVLEREPGEALKFPVSNMSDSKISKHISKEVSISTNAQIVENNTFGFALDIGFEGGMDSTESNFGAKALLKTNAQVSGSFFRGWMSEKGTETKRLISDNIELEPWTQYSIAVAVDRLKLEQKLDITGVLDFAIKIITPNWKDKSVPGFNCEIQMLKSGVEIEADNLSGLARRLLGMAGDLYLDDRKKQEARKTQRLLDNVDRLINEDLRRIKSSITLNYNDAGESSLSIQKDGVWKKDKDGKFSLTSE